MADEVLGISGSMDISDIQKSINDLIGHMQKLNLETDKLSKHFNENFAKIEASSADAATKQKQAMELYSSSIEQAKKQMATLPEQIKAASKEALSFSDSCVSIKNKMMDLKIGSDEFAKLNAELQQNQRAAEQAMQRHEELSNSFNGLTNFVANASASIDAFNGISAAATGSTGLNAVSHGAVTAALAGETAGRAANTEAMGKETEAMTENSQASQSQVENMEQKKTLTNEYSSALDTLTEKIRNNQQVSEQQIQNEINLAQERIKQLEEEKSKKEELMSAKYSEYEKYSSDAILGDPAKKEENLSKAKEAVDAYNQLASEINNTDNSIRQINASINALNSELYENSNAVKNSQDSLSESINQTKNAAEALNNETNKAADNDPFGVQKMSIETLKAEYEATTQRIAELKKEYDGFINKGGEEKYAEKMDKNASETKELNEKLKAVTAELKKQGVEIDKNTAKTKKQANEVGGLFKQLKGGFGGGVGGIFNTLLSGKFLGWATAIGAIAKGLWDASKAAEEYRKSLMPLKHYMDGMDFKTVRQDIMALTATTSKSASDMAGAATYFVKVWESLRTSPEALITMVKSANEFAILSGKSSAEAAKAIANLASEYHLTAQQASQMSAMIANAAKNTTSSFDEMASAISSAGSQAALYGVSFKDMTTLIGYSANQFGGASKAASKFNMMLMTMSGLEAKFRPSAVGMVKALENLKEAYDRGERPQDKFMKRQRAAAEYFIKNADAIKKYGQAIDNTNEKDKLLADRQTTAEANLNKLKNSWNGLLTSLNVNLTPILNNILQFFNRIIGGAQRTADELAFLKDFRAKNPTKTGAASSGMVTFSNGSNEEAELKEYRRQRDDIKNKFATYFKIAKSKYKDASVDAQINIANNALVSFYKQNQQDYNRISKSMFNSMLPKLRAQAAAMEMKPVNSGDIGDGGNNGNDTLKEINKKAKQTEELLKMQRKERLDAEKQQLAAQQMERDARIAAISDDAERERQAMIAAHEKRMEEIERQKKDMLENNIQKAASEYQKKHENDKNYKGFFTQGLEKNVSLTQDQIRQLNAMYDKEVADYSRMIMERQNKDDEYRLQYLEKYGYMYEQRAAIAEKYDKQIAKATSEWQKKSLEEEKKSALSSFDLKQFQANINWDALLGDISRYTKKALKEVQKQIRAFMQTDEYKALNPTEKQVIIRGLQKIESATTTGLPFGEYAKALRELKEARRANESAQGAKEIAYSNPQSSDEIRRKADENAKSAAERLKNAQDKAASSGGNLADRLTLIAATMTKLGSSTQMSLSEVGGAITGVLQGLGAIGEKAGGIVGAILGLLDMIGQQGLDGFIGNVLGSVGKAVGGIFNSVGKIFGLDLGLGGADYSEWQKADAKYKELSNVWDSLIGKKQEYLNMSWGIEAEKTGEEISRLIEMERQQVALAAKARLDSGASAGSHSIWYRMWKGSYKSTRGDNMGATDNYIDKNAGINWQDVNTSVVRGLKNAGLGNATFESMYDMINMTSDQLLWIKENYAGLWAAMDSDFRGYLEDIITYGEKAEDAVKAVQEQILGTSLDNVFDSALSSLQNYADGAENVFDEINQNWQKMINNMLVNSAIGNNLRAKLDEWYQKWYAAYDSDKKIDGKEIADLKEEYNEIIKNAKDEIDALRESGLIKDIDEDSQSATAKAISNITYDQANALEGRLTAIQICGEQQLTEIQIQTKYQERMCTTLDDILVPMRDMDSNIETMVGIQTSMNEHLEAISNNTKCLPGMAADINKMKKKIENM